MIPATAGLLRPAVALAAGAAAPLALSPVSWWPLGIVSVMLLFIVVDDTGARRGAWLGWLYGFGFFGTGASWIYVSINVYGNVPGLFAAIPTLLFVAGLALLFALQCWIYRRWRATAFRVPVFAALWVAFEWLRGWLLTGFPWLYLGYAHIDTWLAGLAPVAGVLGVSFIVALTGAGLGRLCLVTRHGKVVPAPRLAAAVGSFALLWLVPAALTTIDWTGETVDSVEVGIVQANIDQTLKFDPRFIDESLDRYEAMSEPLWDRDIVVWSETSIPLTWQFAGPEIEYFGRRASTGDSALVTGIFYRENDRIYNSITALGDGSGIYHKQKLVPFGEYVPLGELFSGVFRLFDLPMSSLAAGPSDQDHLMASGFALAPYICYEVVYPDFVRRQALGADFLVTVSNDTWFGASFGPLQHLEMAAMRALENGRYMVRATSNGVSAIIDERGRIVTRSEQFVAETLTGTVRIFDGRTPFSYWGSWPVVILCGLILLATGLLQNVNPKNEKNSPGREQG